MSNLYNGNDECEGEKNSSNGIDLVLKPAVKDLGSFSVRRALPSRQQRKVGPWIFFDHAGPAHLNPGEGIDVRPHPHINLATVTYMFEGEFLHRDSIGSVQVIKPGDINLMVAGKGIVHSERTPPEIRKSEHRLHALQLWLALPEADEEIAPAFYHYPANELPTTEIDGVKLRVMMGSAYGLNSPVKTFAETLYVEALLKVGQRLTLPMCEERAIYMAKGEVSSNGTAIEEFTMAILNQQDEFTIEATTDARIAFIGGEELSERFIDWNFVSSNKDRIKQAKEDWQAGRFDKVPEDDEEFIPLP
ncbi:MAG: pirin family protein [Gammaproteobacteria bacterium]|nr:pirin family protein [Gammaproteobacteria bacterium]